MAAAQFLVVGAGALASCLLLPGGARGLTPSGVARLLGAGGSAASLGGAVWVNLLLVTGFSTLGAFGLMFCFQPKISANQAALIYLLEPVFAALFAFWAVGRGMGTAAMAGAGLILTANLLHLRRPRPNAPPQGAAAPDRSG